MKRTLRPAGLRATHEAASALLRRQLLRTDERAMVRVAPCCPGWSLRTVVNHVIGGAERYALLLAGAPTEEIDVTRAKDYSSPNPVRSHRRHEEQFRIAYERAVPGATFAHRAGPVDRQELLRMRILECVVHAWDIGQSLGQGMVLPDELSSVVLRECHPTLTRLAAHGYYAPRPVDQSLPAGARLLAMAGRHATTAAAC